MSPKLQESGWETATAENILSSQSISPVLLHHLDLLLFENFNFEPASDNHTRILDIGCGNGSRTIGMLAEVKKTLPNQLSGIEVTGIDISEDAVITAKSNFTKIFDCLSRFVKVDITQQDSPLEKNSYDLAFAIGSLSAIHNPVQIEAAIHNMYEVIKPGGVLYIQDFRWRTTQIRNYVTNAIEHGLPLGGTRVLNEDRETVKFLGYNFRRWQLNKWLREAGFENIKIEGVDLPNQISAQPDGKTITRKIWVVSANKPHTSDKSDEPRLSICYAATDVLNFCRFWP
jgi:ubiquinone/menaquinone biosynthesis C-methylase UbiE